MIILEVMNFLTSELRVIVPEGGTGHFAAIANIAFHESANSTSLSDEKGAVILTLVNIEEENTLKNTSIYVRNGESIQKRNPILYLNFYVLISCPLKEYAKAMVEISKVIQFFQGKSLFTKENATKVEDFPASIEKISMELFTMNFEQVNHLWGILGGKHLPSVMYKLRLVPIQGEDKQPVLAIKEISAEGNVAN